MAQTDRNGTSVSRNTPDFAFPEKVEQAAVRDLDIALQHNDGAATVNALVRLGLAKAVVSADSLPVVLHRIAEVEAGSRDVAVKALLNLLQANIYVSVYSQDSYRINNRADLAGTSDDYRTWSKSQFMAKVRSLVDSALQNRGELLSTPVSDYKSVINLSGSSATFYPTLYDFAAYQGIDCFTAFDGQMALNPRLAMTPLDPTLYPADNAGNLGGGILKIYRSLVEGRELEAPAILARGNMLEYILPRLFGPSATQPVWTRGSGGPETEPQSRQYSAFMNAYGECASSPYAVELLLNIPDGGLSVSEQSTLYTLLGDYISHNPSYFNLNAVKNLRDRLARKDVDVVVPVQMARNLPAKIKVTSRNVNQVVLNVYDVSRAMADKRESYYRMPASMPTPVKTMTVDFTGTVPFSDSKEVEIALPEYGVYVVVPSFQGRDKSDSSYPVIACSDISAGIYSGVGSSEAVAVDVISGAPREGVSMYFRPWSRAQANELLPGVTDASGTLSITKDKPGSVEPHYGKDVYAPVSNYYAVTENNVSSAMRGEIFTSLNLYHPGDKVDFAVLAYDADVAKVSIAKDRPVRIALRDANYMEIDSVRVTTDKWGRAEGSFTLPAEGLTGTFTLTMSSGKNQFASRQFMVSDYKLPTFSVKVTDVQRPATLGEAARLSGSALTFAGFPVGEAQVRAQVKVRSGFWYWASTSPVFYESEVTTDSAGVFSIDIPADVIASSPAPEGFFIVDVAVTSPDGETHSTQSGFNMGKPLIMTDEIPDIYQADGKGQTEPRILVRDYNGKDADVELNYTVTGVDRQLYGGADSFRDVAAGVCRSGNVSAILKGLPSGAYRLSFAPVDSALANEIQTDVTVYRSTDRHCPVNELLWIPGSSFTADENGVVEIPYGSAAKSPKIYMTVSDKSGHIVESRWLSPSGGMDRVKITLPSEDALLRVYFRIVSNLTSSALSVDVRPASSRRAISISTETFRDKVTPGSKETLRFKVKGVAGASAESAVLLDMSNKAIDVLSPNPLNFAVQNVWGRAINIDGWYFGVNSIYLSGLYKPLKVVGIDRPEWEFYGQAFHHRFVQVKNYSYRMAAMKVRGTAKMDMDDAVEESAADMEVSEAMAPAYAAAGAMDNGAVLSEEGTATTASSANDNAPEQAYRPSEMPLAFFRPMLLTDADGNLEVTYTVPDASTTWILRSLAYNRALSVAENQQEIVASKPVMVSANAPRFLRTGDSVTLQASVMNATDSAQIISTRCEILDYTTGKVVDTYTRTDTVDAMGRTVVNVGFVAPADLQGVIYRVRSSAGSFSDGEQVLIPLLPSSQDVVESQMFYIAPGQNHFTMEVDAVTDGRAYLKFTENPAWEVVSALPGLRESKINSSLEAAATIFSAAVADGLMKEFPEVARTLRKWSENRSDSALVSALEKDEELKSIVLSSTPWVSDALSMTERMQRLVLLLDKRNTSRALNRGIADLAKCVASDGGFGWTPQYTRSSEWCTAGILDMLGNLNRLGWLPTDKRLAGMLENAVTYLDKVAAKDFAKYPKRDYTSYCYTRQKFPEIKQSTAAARVTRETVQRIIAGWKNHSVAMKGVDAIVLNSDGYNATARQILESLRQYATETPEKGMWWQQLESAGYGSLGKVGTTCLILDAFAMAAPGDPAIDRIRQWLLLEKTNTDWGNGIITSQAVASILTSGKDWTVNSAGTAIRVGNELLTPDATEYATGTFTQQITPLVADGARSLTIDRQGNYPSCGAIVVMRHAKMENIKATGCRELSVEKRMSVYNGSEWVPSSTFKVGDRVKVSLIIKADADMDYVVIQDMRAAALEPVEQLPAPIWSEGLCFYRENRDTQTNIFIDRMPRGVYVLDYELFATQGGAFASGAAEVQSLYNPAISAHSGGAEIEVK